MSGLHNTQRSPAQKTWPDCTYCAGTGLTSRKFQRGFFAYEAGVTCPECSAKHQDEIRRKYEPEIVLTSNPYVGMKNLSFEVGTGPPTSDNLPTGTRLHFEQTTTPKGWKLISVQLLCEKE